MRATIRYECSACGWRWSRDVKQAKGVLIPQPAPVIIVPRELGPCECDVSDESDAPAPE